MPYVKKSKKPTRKTYKRRPKSTATRFKSNVVLGRGFPKKMTMTHKYFNTFQLQNETGTPSTIATRELVCNGLFEPDTIGTTHQPLYFDQMKALYTDYTVIGSKINVRFINNGLTSSGVIVGIFMNDDISTISPQLLSTMVEQTGAKNGILDGGANRPVINRSYKWSAKKRQGGSILGNEALKGNNAANPIQKNTWVIYMQDLLKISTQKITVAVEVEYISVWTGLRDISGS